MNNWRERVEGEISKRATEESAKVVALNIQRDRERVEKEQTKIIQEQRVGKIASERFKQFDSLVLPQKLQDINRDVWKGLGDFQSKEDVSNIAIRKLVSLNFIEPQANNIDVAYELVFKDRSGWHNESREGFDGTSVVAPEQIRVNGPYKEYVGRKITGWKRLYEAKRPLEIIFLSDIDSDMAKIRVCDHYYPNLKKPEVELVPGWEVKVVEKERYFSDEKYSEYGELSFPIKKFDSHLASTIIDAFLVQSCAKRLPHVEEWFREQAAVNARIAEIQSKVGQVIKDSRH